MTADSSKSSEFEAPLTLPEDGSINPYLQEAVYDTPEYRQEILAEYKRLGDRRRYLASEVIRLWWKGPR